MADRNKEGLKAIFDPVSIAVVGASPTPGKLSGVILESLAGAGFSGAVYPVNPAYKEVMGRECLPSLNSIEGGVDLAVMAVPAPAVVEILREAEGSVRAAVIVGGGFGEAGGEGVDLERELKRLSLEGGIRIVGPNCLGLFDNVSRVDTFFIPRERIQRPARGGLSVVSQSGSFALTAIDELATEGIGVARVVSYGNKADVDESDCLDFLADDTETSAVALYIESIDEGRRFVEAAARCAAKKPVMAVKVGRVEEAARAAASHTGAITGRYALYRAAFRKAGVVEVEGYEDFIDGCRVLGITEPAGGRRVAVITDAGGMGVSIADACVGFGLELPPLPEMARKKLVKKVPPICSIENPLDLTGSVLDGWIIDSLKAVLSESAYDMAIVAPLWGPPGLTDALPAMIRRVADEIKKPVIVCTPGGEFSRAKSALYRDAGFNAFTTPEGAARAARVLSGGSGGAL